MNYRPAALRAALKLARGRRRPVIMTPRQIGLGNFLYLWLQADLRQAKGEYCRVELSEDMKPWLDVFPAVAPLVLSRDAMSFFQTREAEGYQNYGSEFRRSDLDSFITKRLLTSPQLKRAMAQFQPVSHSLTINVRRGDFYTVPLYRGQYSFDVVEYVRCALDRQDVDHFDEIVVVSDDPEWCRAKLGWLRDRTRRLAIAGLFEGPILHMARLAQAQRLILTNSTFGYWGGYLHTVRTSIPKAVTVPWFHCRGILEGRAFQLDPNWKIIETIPGGWDG